MNNPDPILTSALLEEVYRTLQRSVCPNNPLYSEEKINPKSFADKNEFTRLGAQLLVKHNISWEHVGEEWIESKARPINRHIWAPIPDTRFKLMVFTHECGHIVRQHLDLPWHVCKAEREAWAFTFKHLRKWRLMIPQYIEFARLATINVTYHGPMYEEPHIISKMMRFIRSQPQIEMKPLRELLRKFEDL
jgi:hypothetical protein